MSTLCQNCVKIDKISLEDVGRWDGAELGITNRYLVLKIPCGFNISSIVDVK